MGSILRRLLFLFRRDQFDRDLDEELRFHEDMKARALADAQGLTSDEARAAARRQLGNPLRLREQAREPWSFGAIETFVHDLHHTMRLMRRDPAFTFTALTTLALGIGLTTAIFSVAYGVLWRPLPYASPDRLVIISSVQQAEKGVRTFWTWSPASYEALRGRVTALDHLAAYAPADVALTGRGEALRVSAVGVSPNFFDTLGIAPALGRSFLTGAPAPDDDRTIIVSDRLWRASLNADPAILGQSVMVDGVPRVVVGVLPPEFTFKPVVGNGALALPDAEVFVPDLWPSDTGNNRILFLLGRIKPGTTVGRAQAELTTLINDSSIVAPGGMGTEGALAPNVRTLARAIGLQQYGTAPVRSLLLILLWAVSFVLLIACANVANLQIARLSARRGELSVRMALGAGRLRIVRQLLTEAIVLSLLGAALGVVLARIAIDVTLPLVPQFVLPSAGSIVIDARVMVFSFGLSVLSTLFVGLVPMLRISGAAFGEDGAMHDGETRTTSDRRGERLRTLLVAGQIAMTFVLLIGAGLLVRSFVRLTSVSPGFESSRSDGVVQTVRVTLPERLYDEPERIHLFARGVLGRVQYLPGVTSASVINSLPFGMMFIQGDFDVEGQPKPTLKAGTPNIEPGYFKTMGIALLAGRDFTPDDTAAAPRVAIISERVARESFPGGPNEALGRRVRLNVIDRGEWLTVVGVVADIHQRGLDRGVQPMIYVPFQQDRSGFIRFVSFVARTATPDSVVEAIRAEIRRTAPDLPVESTATMSEAVAASMAQPRFRMLLLGLFAIAAMLIATCGIYGLMAYSVTQRRREIGVRIAVGAEGRDVLWLVLARALRIVAAGLLAGIAGAAGLARVLRRFLFEVTPTDPVAFMSVALLVIAVGLLAAWLPGRRAARIDPCTALRAE